MQEDIIIRLCMQCKKIHGCTNTTTSEQSSCSDCGQISTCQFHSFDLSATKECETCLTQKDCNHSVCASGNWTDCITCSEESSCQNIQKARIGMNQVSHGYCSKECLYIHYPDEQLQEMM